VTTKNMRIERREPQPAVCLEVTTSDIGAELQHVLPATFGWVGQHGGQIVGAPFTRYLEMGPSSFRIQAGVPTAAMMQASGDVAAVELPGGDIATADHYGPYEKVVETATALTEYLQKQGRSVAGPLWESYVTDPTTVSDPEEVLTVVSIPLA
jgi:AraC family transcriptional regulator